MRLYIKRDGMRRSIISFILIALALVLFSVPGFSAIQAPANVQAQIVHNEVHLTWNATANVTQYNIYSSRNETTWTLLGNTTKTFYNIQLNAANKTQYGVWYFKIEAVNGTDTNSTVATIKFYPPAAPQGFTAVVQSGHVQLSWNSVTGATGYYIYRGNSAGNETLLISVIGTSYTDESVVGGNTYYYYVTGYNATGESQASIVLKISVSSGGGVYSTHGISFNSYLLAISIFLLAFSIPIWLYGQGKHKDVAMYSSIVGALGLVVSWGMVKFGYDINVLKIGNVALNYVMAAFGLVLFLIGVVITLWAKDEKKIREHLDVGRFSMLMGIVFMALSWLWSYLVA